MRVTPQLEQQEVPPYLFKNGKGLYGYVRHAMDGEWWSDDVKIEGEAPLSVSGSRDPSVGVPEGPEAE